MRAQLDHIFRRRDRRERVLIVVLVTTTVLRILYGLLVADPNSGPDAPTYATAASIFAEHGFFAAAPGIPYWPAGYPGFVSLFHFIFGEGRAFVVGQVLLLGFGSWSAYRIVKRIFGVRVATVTLIGLCLNVALTGAAVTLMYEVPILAGLVIGVDLMLSAERSVGRRRSGLMALGGLIVGLFATMQATIIVPGLLLAAISCWRLPLRRTAQAALLGAVILAMAIGPAILMARNIHRGDGVGIAGNLGITILVGAAGAGRPIPCPMTDHTVQSDRALTRCALEYKISHPVETAIVAANIEWKLWAPMIGPLAHYGSWFHAFNYRRALPSFVVGSWFPAFDRWTSKAWEIGTIGLVLAGVVLAFRREQDRLSVVWMVVPILSWMAMHALIAGDARFRLPISPFYTAFIAYALVASYDLLRQRAASGANERRGLEFPTE